MRLDSFFMLSAYGHEMRESKRSFLFINALFRHYPANILVDNADDLIDALPAARLSHKMAQPGCTGQHQNETEHIEDDADRVEMAIGIASFVFSLDRRKLAEVGIRE